MYNWLNFIFTTGFTKAIISLRSERKFHIISLRSERKFQPLRGCASGAHLPQVSPGDEKEVLKVLKLDPIFIPLLFYEFKNNKLTIL
jgi:hypothetical protein